MCRLRNIAMCDYQESVTTGQTHGRTDRQNDRQTPDKVIPMCRFASQAAKKGSSCKCFMILNFRHDYIFTKFIFLCSPLLYALEKYTDC